MIMGIMNIMLTYTDHRPFGQNNARVIIYSMKDTSGPMSKQLESTAPQEVRDPSIKTTMTPKYPSTCEFI